MIKKTFGIECFSALFYPKYSNMIEVHLQTLIAECEWKSRSIYQAYIKLLRDYVPVKEIIGHK